MSANKIVINGDIFNKNEKDFTELEKQEFLDNFIEFIESKEMLFLGITK